MKLLLLTTGGKAPGWAEDAVADYGARIRRYGGIEERHLKPEPFRGDEAAVRAAEAARVLALTSARDRLVCLDERGEDLDTHGFARLLTEGLGAEGRCVFVIGGPYGHDPSVRQKAWRTLRLSRMVLNHQVARVVLYEQLYRAFTVLRGEPYHH